jgi:hypothetical protein
MKGVVEQEKWGRSAAEDRYGKLDHKRGAPYPPDQSRAEDFASRMGWKGVGDVPTNSWLRGNGEKNPNFDRTPSGKNRGGRKSSPGY